MSESRAIAQAATTEKANSTATLDDQIDINPVLAPIDPANLAPAQSFACITLTRADIAGHINSVAAIEGEEIEPTDSRLTDDSCRQFAEEYGQVASVDSLDIADAEGWITLISSAFEDLNGQTPRG